VHLNLNSNWRGAVWALRQHSWKTLWPSFADPFQPRSRWVSVVYCASTPGRLSVPALPIRM
jgi:hypothetical protein